MCTFGKNAVLECKGLSDSGLRMITNLWTRKKKSVLHNNFCRASVALMAVFLSIILSACGPSKSENPNAAAPVPESEEMVDSGVGPMSFKPIRKPGSKLDKEDRLQAFIRNSGKGETAGTGRGNGVFLSKDGGVETSVAEEGLGGGWTIMLKSLTGAEARNAELFLSVVRSDVPDAFLQRRTTGMVIATGRFDSDDSPAAQAEWKRIRSLEVKGLQPYAGATFLAPEVAVAAVPTGGEFNLRAIGEAIGPKESKYTLEVAVYGRPDRETPTEAELKEFRTKAEEAVKLLRRDREEAYFLHTPRQSIVTVGVYGQEEIEGDESAEVKAARVKHPHVLLNGEGVKVRGKGKDAVMQATRVVEIPKK